MDREYVSGQTTSEASSYPNELTLFDVTCVLPSFLTYIYGYKYTCAQIPKHGEFLTLLACRLAMINVSELLAVRLMVSAADKPAEADLL